MKKIKLDKEDKNYAIENKQVLFRIEFDWKYASQRPEHLLYTGTAGALTVEEASELYQIYMTWQKARFVKQEQ